VNVGSDGLRLQLTSTTPGEAGDFVVETTAGVDFELTSPATDAVLDLGGTLRARSATNTFADLIAGVSVTVTERNASAVVEVAEDPATVAAKVKTLVDAVNSALSSIKKHSSTATGSTAVLKGDSELRTLALQLRDAVSDTVAGAGSPATVGIELNRDGTVKFTEKTFLAALQSDPEVAGRLLSGAPQEGATPAVEGISQRLQALAKRATDSTTGSLTLLAEGRDELADDFQDRIDSWDLRLELRRETLTRQFTAMETALSSLKSQSSWLAGQLGSLSG
jgi:flagellar capping protein FliD